MSAQLLLPPFVGAPRDNAVYHCDLFTLCDALPDSSVDLIASDLPYGQTQSAWDVMIPLDAMWKEFKRIIKPHGAIVLTATEPFKSLLVVSNLSMFRCDWVWNKVSPVGHLNVHKRPMQQHESVIVFSDGQENYYPQLRDNVSMPFGVVGGSSKSVYGAAGADKQYGVGYPVSIISYPRPNNLSGGGLHPNQKPVELFEYLIRTYSREGDLVLDPTCGSGTTAIAARACKRRFIVGDKLLRYVVGTRNRLRLPFEPRTITTPVDYAGTMFAEVQP